LDTPKLTDKQQMFCKEYLIDLNATQACIRAGYSEKTANRIASENLSKLVIQEEISRLKLEREKRVKLTADKVLNDIERVRQLSEGKEQYNISLKASELQGKHLAMFTDKHQVDGEVQMPVINISLADDG
jgi:phage terminase small subunit